MLRPARLSFELMETFVGLVNSQGDASLAGERLGINQPSISKRPKLLQQSDRVGPTPWGHRRGKTWPLTAEGTRCLPAVQSLLRLEQSLMVDADTRASLQPTVSIDCGQTAVTFILREPLSQFRKEFKDAQVRVSTPRGSAQIQGVASGTYDFELVTHGDEDIRRIAGRALYVEPLFEDPFILVGDKHARQSVRQLFDKLPQRPVGLKHLVDSP